MSSGRILCIGECMVELAPTGDGTYRQGFAGDTFNMA
jgi:2-dehydro-3-deoxygluconokinase